MKIGDTVFWTDPDAGLCSAVYKITRIVDDIAELESEDGSELEAPLHELTPYKEALPTHMLKLELKVFYNLEGESPDDMKDRLDKAVWYLFDRGFITGDSAATVEDWDYKITES